MTSSLTPFGHELAKAYQRESASFDSSVSSNLKAYKKNLWRIKLLRDLILEKKKVLIIGAGHIPDVSDFEASVKDLIQSGVNWTNFNPKLNLEILSATHSIALEAAHFHSILPNHLVHGVYCKVPPVISNSFTIRWADPFLNGEFGGNPAPKDLEKIILKSSISSVPFLPSVRNVVFFNAMVMILLGAQEIYFAGIDPLNPEYFFSKDPSLTVDVIRAVSKTNPFIAEWDGRNERISGKLTDSKHRKSQVICNLLSPAGSGVSRRQDVMEQGFKLLTAYCKFKKVKVGYIGQSKFMNNLGLNRVL